MKKYDFINKQNALDLLFITIGLTSFLLFIYYIRFFINLIVVVLIVYTLITYRSFILDLLKSIPSYLYKLLKSIITLPVKIGKLIIYLPQLFKKSKEKRLNRSMWGDIGLFLFLFAFALFSVWPLLFAINNAFKPMDEIFMFPPKLFVKNPTMKNFNDLFTVVGDSWVPFTRYFSNTLLITAVGTFGHVILASMAAYPLAKYKFPGSKFIFNIIVLSLMFAPQVTEIPNYITISKLRLIDTYWAVILPSFAFPLGLYLMKQFMEGVPMSIIESAKVEGASEFTIFWKVVMPLVKPAWLTLVILLFQQLWVVTGGNFIYSEQLKTLSYALSQIVTGGIARTGVSAAVTLIMMTVPITVFIITQSNVLQTFASSGMKE